MIQINDRSALNVRIQDVDFDLTPTSFNHLKINQEADLIIPSFELSLNDMTPSMLSKVSKTNWPIEISFGSSFSSMKKYNFVISNYSLVPKGDRFGVILTGILDLKDFMNKIEIKSYPNMTSDAVLKQLVNVTPDIQYVGVDSQTWVKHNISEKELVYRLMLNSFISEETFPLPALTIDKKLIVRDYLAAMKEAEALTLSNDVTGNENSYYRYDSYTLESDRGVWSYLFNEGRKQPVRSLLDSEGPLTNLDVNQLNIAGNSINQTSDNRDFPLLFDNGNCHEKYYLAYCQNLAKRSNLMANNIYVNLDSRNLTEDEVKLLDCVKFLPNNGASDWDTCLKGKYIVTGKSSFFSPRDFGLRLTLNRDYQLE